MFAARQGFIGAAGAVDGEFVFNTVDNFTSTTTWTAPAGVTRARILAVGGGGSGGCGWQGGGGGGGGFVDQVFDVTPGYQYDITIGAGGSGTYNINGSASGANTTVSYGGSPIVTALGGGRGGCEPGGAATWNASKAYAGGSGGGGCHGYDSLDSAIKVNSGFECRGNLTIQLSTIGYGEGTDGGSGWSAVTSGGTYSSYLLVGGGGGGAGAAGEDFNFQSTVLYAGDGGDGFVSNISSTDVTYAGGGGGGARPVNTYSNYVPGTGGAGGGQSATKVNGHVTGGGGTNTGGGGAGVAKISNSGSPTTADGGAANSGSGGSGFVAIGYYV